MINPNIVDGQVHGGVAQGIGGVLYEHNVYDADGNPLASTFMDYLVPTAHEIPEIETFHIESPAVDGRWVQGRRRGWRDRRSRRGVQRGGRRARAARRHRARPAAGPRHHHAEDPGGREMTATDLYYDPYDYAIDADPYPIWKRLRDEAPVYWNEQHGFYALSRYDDVLNGLLDTETFVSSHGIVLEMITDEPYDNIPMMIMKDPPEHTKLRKLVSRAFTPRRIADLEAKIAKLCQRLPRHRRRSGRVRLHRHVRRAAPADRDPRPGRLSRGPRGGVPRPGRREPAHRGRRRDARPTASIAHWSRRAARSTTRRSPSSPS